MIDIAVVAGGRSAEHDVSCRSGARVASYLDRARYRVWPVFVERGGRWRVAAEPVAPGAEDPFAACGSGQRPGAALAELLDRCRVSVVFPALHGRFGEDGTIQGMLELHDVPFVGSGTAASAVGMDKIRTREAFLAHRVPMAKAFVPDEPLGRGDPRALAERIAGSVGFPCFLKVDLSGSTIGVERADGPGDVGRFLQQERGHGQRWVAEALVRGEEITVPVLGNSGEELEALPPVGIYPVGASHFTYESKYQPGRCEEIVPPRGLDAAGIAAVQELGRRCHAAVWCDGMSRTDMIVTASGPIVLEINTLPGMTEASLLPKAARARGLEFPALLDRLVELAFARHRAVAGAR
jgi:D-alanine-D-alanine ligase